MATITIYLLNIIIFCSQMSMISGYGSLPETLPTEQLYQYSHHVQWSCLNSKTGAYNCCDIKENIIVCQENGPLLRFGHCVTYDEGKLTIAWCRHYFQPSCYDDVAIPGYIPLPIVIAELNDSMCHPMNRKGVVCSKCVDGYGPSITSYGYKCVKCSSAWYRVPLFLVIELLPITIFYVIVLAFQVSVTTPPIPCFIMYVQFVVVVLRYGSILSDFGGITLDVKIFHFLYGIFNLDFFHFILPPFCVSDKVQVIHVVFLGYISVFYPQFLIFLTWFSVKLHDSNVRIFVWLWKPCYGCFYRMRRSWITKGDLIDVFITFFLLSYTKCVYQAVFLLGSRHVSVLDSQHHLTKISTADVDPSLAHFGKHHLPYAFFSLLTLFVFIILPSLLLIFYPIRAFRLCLSKCHLNSIALNIFTDKLQSCYRNGLDGGRDMRCFSGIFFNLRIAVYLFLLVLHLIVKIHRWLLVGIIFTMISVLIALIGPYQKTYMNVLDTLLFLNLALISFLADSNLLYSVIARLLLVVPIVFIVFLILLRNLHRQLNNCCDSFELNICRLCTTCNIGRRLTLLTTKHTQHTTIGASTAAQPLLQPGSPTEINYGSY